MPFLLLFLIQTLAPTWDTPQLFTAIISANVKLQPVLKQIHPNEWKGAPASYQSQWESAVKANQALQTHAAAVAKAPENLGESLRLLEEVRDLNESLLELSGGVRQYQNPELADLLDGMLAEGKAARDAYSQRVLDLAAQREEQFDVADHEAQRCRAQLSSQPNKQTKR
jgi:hypothetical protein